jgi:CheY-like chemotaxis protein
MSDVPVVLLVEDRDDDALIVRRAFEKLGVPNPIKVVTDGDQAISYLAGTAVYADRKLYPMPGLVLLDLKMPVRDGFEVLEWIRSQPGISGLPVVVLTTTDAIKDVSRAYAAGANSFLVKPMEFEQYMGLLQTLKKFWLNLGSTPGGGS